MKKIHQVIQAARKQKNISQSVLAKKAGITQAMVSKVEAGNDVQLSTLTAIAKALDMEIVLATKEQAFHLMRAQQQLPEKKKQSLLERLQVSDE